MPNHSSSSPAINLRPTIHSEAGLDSTLKGTSIKIKEKINALSIEERRRIKGEKNVQSRYLDPEKHKIDLDIPNSTVSMALGLSTHNIPQKYQ